MADIVIGIASSHTPQLSSGVDMWLDHAERDRRNPRLLGKDARWHTYEELLADADPALGHELRPAVWDAKYRRCQDAIEALSGDLNKAHADIAVVIGDDQREMFRDDGIPAFACFAGDELVDMPPLGEALERMPKGIRAASWAAHSDHEQTHPVRADLSAHVAEQLARDGVVLACNGSRRDVFPSPMLRQATGGRFAYELTIPRSAARPKAVDIFAPAPKSAVLAAVDDQRAWFERWRDSGIGEGGSP